MERIIYDAAGALVISNNHPKDLWLAFLQRLNVGIFGYAPILNI
jgi:hypothetical protein